jgi:hypothetical protein
MRPDRRRLMAGWTGGFVLLLGLGGPVDGAAPRGAASAPALRQYDSPYYAIHSDLDGAVVREASARLTAMAEEYRRRTQGFGGTIRAKLPFYLYRSRADYYRAGGLKGSAGFYNGKVLVAAAMSRKTADLWRVLQHEGFHQFAHRVIGGSMPIWLNEGLAEYFSEGLWTGDGFVTGVVPPQRLRRVRAMVRTKRLLPFADMVKIDREAWTADVRVRNYDQAWSMVHFLVHGGSGRYRKALLGFIRDVSRSRPPRQAFEERFGRNYDAFQRRCAGWWLALDDNPTADLYTRATVAALTSFLARAHLQGLRFRTVQEFFAAAGAGKIEAAPGGHIRLYLPNSLLKEHLARSAGMKTWSLQTRAGLPALELDQRDGATFVGLFKPRGKDRPTITVTITPSEKPKAKPVAPRGGLSGRRALPGGTRRAYVLLVCAAASTASRMAATMVCVAGR